MENMNNNSIAILDVLSREIITFYTLTLMVVVPGIWFCLMFYKYKMAPIKKKATCIIVPNPSFRKANLSTEIEESLYDNIDDADILGYKEPNANSPNSLISDESTSTDRLKNATAFNDERKQDCISQPLIIISSFNIRDNTTQATIHRIESSASDNKRDAVCESECVMKNYNVSRKDNKRLPFQYEMSSINVKFTVPQRCISNIPERVSQSCANLDIVNFNEISKAQSDSNIV